MNVTIAGTNRLKTEEIVRRLRIGIELLKLRPKDGDGVQEWEVYNKAAEQRGIPTSERSKYIYFAQFFGDPKFIQEVFKNSTFAMAVLGREYDPKIDIPERFVIMLADVANMPFNTMLALGQMGVNTNDRIRWVRLIMLGILESNTEYIRKLIGKKIPDQSEYAWQGWLQQHGDEPMASGAIPENLRIGYEDVQSYPGYEQEEPIMQELVPVTQPAAPEIFTGSIDISQLLQQISGFMQQNTHYLSQIERLEKELAQANGQVQVFQHRTEVAEAARENAETYAGQLHAIFEKWYVKLLMNKSLAQDFVNSLDSSLDILDELNVKDTVLSNDRLQELLKSETIEVNNHV